MPENVSPMTPNELAALDTRRGSGNLWWKLTAEEIARAYAAGARNFKGAILRGAILRGANLYGANLEGANLRGANLEGANLRGANLGGANLEGANLYGAYLEGANLEGANLEGANLRGANLGGANLRGAYLGGAYLGGAYLGGAYLEGANLLNSPGIYVAYAPNLSSRNAALLGGIVLEDGEVQLRFWAGCKQRISAETLRGYVADTHGEGDGANIYAKQYEAAITFIEAVFAADMAAGKWEYLKTWEADHAQPEPAALAAQEGE